MDKRLINLGKWLVIVDKWSIPPTKTVPLVLDISSAQS